MNEFSFDTPFSSSPAELALNYVEVVDHRDELSISKEEERALQELDKLSEISNMHGSYFTQAGKALAIPFQFERDEKVTYLDYQGITFEGSLETYSIVKIGRLIGATSIRALCLTFNNVTTLPLFTDLPSEYLLHVPALAVDSMSKTEE